MSFKAGAMDPYPSRRPNRLANEGASLGGTEVVGTGGCSRSADRKALQRAILKLSPKQQQVIFLRFFRLLPSETVAAALASRYESDRGPQGPAADIHPSSQVSPGRRGHEG